MVEFLMRVNDELIEFNCTGYLRLILMLFVCFWAFSSPDPSGVVNSLSGFAIPAFFILSGYYVLDNKRNVRMEKTLRKIKRTAICFGFVFLFYVAITRAKKHTFVLYNENMPSVFVTEMLEGEDDNLMICPLCKKGRLKKIKDGVSINGNKYRYHLCSNSVAGCHFPWLVFYDEESDILRKYHREMDCYFIDIKTDKDGWPIIGGQITNSRRRGGIPPSPSFPTYIPPPFPPPPPSGGSYSPPLPPIEGSPDDLPF